MVASMTLGIGALAVLVLGVVLYVAERRADGDLAERARSVGETFGAVVWLPWRYLGITLYAVAVSVGRWIPFTKGIWKGLFLMSAKGMQKSVGADALSLTHFPNGIDPEPVKWVDGEEGERQKAGWKAHGRDKIWDPGAEGRSVERMGKADVILADEDSPQKAHWVECNFAHALDLGHVDGVFSDATVNHITVEDGREALADGGAEPSVEEYISVQDPGSLKDALFPLESRAGYGGRVGSVRKVKHTYQEKLGSDKEQEAETRGYLAGLMGRRDDVNLLWLLVVAILGAFVLGYGPDIINAVFASGGGGGGGGGGAGGMLPIMMGLV